MWRLSNLSTGYWFGHLQCPESSKQPLTNFRDYGHTNIIICIQTAAFCQLSVSHLHPNPSMRLLHSSLQSVYGLLAGGPEAIRTCRSNPGKTTPILMIKYLKHSIPPVRVHILLFFSFVEHLEAENLYFLLVWSAPTSCIFTGCKE